MTDSLADIAYWLADLAANGLVGALVASLAAYFVRALPSKETPKPRYRGFEDLLGPGTGFGTSLILAMKRWHPISQGRYRQGLVPLPRAELSREN